MLPNGEAGDDVRRVAGLGGLGDFPHRAIGGRGVVVRDQDHDAGQHQPDERGEIKSVRRAA